jgi:hypothetical protein
MEAETVMKVNDKQVAALRALVIGDMAENRRLLAQFDRAVDGAGYSALVNAAFFEAVDRRFKEGSPADVVEYVADVRSRSDDVSDKVDPNVAEQLIRKVITGQSTDDINSRASATTKVFLLAALMADANFGIAEADQFLAAVRKIADHLLRDE